MAGKNEVVIKFLGDSSGYDRVSNQVVVKTDSVGKKIAAVFGGLQLDRAARQVFQFGQDSIAAFKESEQSSAKLADAFSRFPALADSNAAAFTRQAEALARKTKFDDDATKTGQAALAQFGLTGREVQKLTPLLQDYAAKTGKDMPTAAAVLGKAVLGNGKALKQIGLDFQDTGSKAGNLEQLMGGLQAKVGGFAENEGKTAAGRAEILKNQFGELQETVGEKLLPVLSKLTEIGLGVVNFFSQLSPGVQTAIGVVVGLLGAVFLITKAVQAWTAVQAAFNVVMAMNPIGLMVIAIAALIAGIILAYNKVGWFRDAINGLISVGKSVAGVYAKIFDGMIGAAKAAFNGVARLWNNSIGKIAFKVPSWIPGIGGNKFDVPNIPYLAEGGIVTKPTLAVIGEAGPEAVVPLNGSNTPNIGGTAGGDVHVHVNFEGQPLMTERHVQDAVVAAVEAFFGRGGSIGNGRGQFLQPT